MGKGGEPGRCHLIRIATRMRMTHRETKVEGIKGMVLESQIGTMTIQDLLSSNHSMAVAMEMEAIVPIAKSLSLSSLNPKYLCPKEDHPMASLGIMAITISIMKKHHL
jgi:hypothetical protein